MVLCFDVDTVALEEVECVVCETLVKHGQDFRGDIVNCDFDVRDECGIDSTQVFVTEVEKLGGEFDTSC